MLGQNYKVKLKLSKAKALGFKTKTRLVVDLPTPEGWKAS